MSEKLLPQDIYAYLTSKVLGQEDVLKKVAVAIYKHINNIRAGNILLIGNSGTGKTTIMTTIRQFYQEHQDLARYRTLIVMNANLLGGEYEGDVNTFRLFKSLETEARNLLGPNAGAKELKQYMENATVCIDEVDKISSRISDKVSASGIAIQQSLLTLLEGERVLYETTVLENGRQEAAKIPLDTSKLMFLCGGAFEGLYDQVYQVILNHEDERRFKEMAQSDWKGGITYRLDFTLKEYMKLNDLFRYGMVPQFISRFSAISVLEDLGKEELKQIMLGADDSPFTHSREYFRAMGIELRMTDPALEIITDHALRNTRIGARALREIFSRIMAPLEFDPFGSDELSEQDGGKVLTIDQDTVHRALPH